MKKVLLLGEPMALLMAEQEGKLENVEHFQRAMSGAEVNVAIGLTRLGHETEYVTRLGDDPFGYYIKNELQRNGIGIKNIVFDPVYRTGIQLKNKVTDGSDPYAPYYRKESAASKISREDVERIDLSDIQLVHVTGIPPALSQGVREATEYLMERARDKGIFITFDPNLRPALWENEEVMKKVLNHLASYADLVLPGIAECRILTGKDTKEEAAEFYHSLGVETVIIKDGSNGAYLSQRKIGKSEKQAQIPGFHVEKVVDTVGAGDGFAVGVLSGILEGKSIEESVLRGNAIGAIQVMHRGDNEGLPVMETLEQFMRDKGKI